MNFDYPGYDLIFIQKQPCRDSSAHLFTYIFKFYSPVTKLIYLLHADYHQEHIFALKFYAKKDRHSDRKYSNIINKGDLPNILITCLKSVPLLLNKHENVSFGFVGSRTVDKKTKLVEEFSNNQRFRVYSEIVQLKIGFETFEHYEYKTVSGYLLINKKDQDVTHKESAIVQMFAKTYPGLVNI